VNTLFAGGDVGGSRVLLAVMYEYVSRSLSFRVLDHGVLGQESLSSWQRVSVPQMATEAQILNVLMVSQCDLVVFSSSVHDVLPLSIARVAKGAGIPVVHILDGWAGYRRRMEMDNCVTFEPDIHAVMDDLSRRAAIHDGLREDSLIVTGQPVLATLGSDSKKFSHKSRSTFLNNIGVADERIFVLFVSEPVAADQGIDITSQQFRGYTEREALESFCHSLQMMAGRLFIGVLCHPRQDRNLLSDMWGSLRGQLQGTVLPKRDSRDYVCIADAVAGMASVLLYEAWLLGKPVLSVQPGLRLPPLRMLAKREGVAFADSDQADRQRDSIVAWVRELLAGPELVIRPELTVHENAAASIVCACENLYMRSKRSA
jgi:hypothetical protein